MSCILTCHYSLPFPLYCPQRSVSPVSVSLWLLVVQVRRFCLHSAHLFLLCSHAISPTTYSPTIQNNTINLGSFSEDQSSMSDWRLLLTGVSLAMKTWFVLNVFFCNNIMYHLLYGQINGIWLLTLYKHWANTITLNELQYTWQFLTPCSLHLIFYIMAIHMIIILRTSKKKIDLFLLQRAMNDTCNNEYKLHHAVPGSVQQVILPSSS